MKLTKIHIALLTNFTEGVVKNEHITMYYSREVNASTVINRMLELNKLLPTELGNVFQKTPVNFRSWTGENVTALVTNHLRWAEPMTRIFEGIEKVHVTLALNADSAMKHYMNTEAPTFNWEHGGTIGECHAGFKVGKDREMQYFTVRELQDEIEMGIMQERLSI